MKKINNIIWGIVLVIVGILFTLNALEITNFDMFFDGWWTLFIIIPCTVGLFTEREKMGNLIGIAIGVALLLGCQEIVSFSKIWKIALPVFILIIGLKMLFSATFGAKTKDTITKLKEESGNKKKACAAFSGCDMNFGGQVFEGAEITAVFGGVECDLRNAIIEKDCVIETVAVFGGVDILVSENVNVKVNSQCIFGGISNKTSSHKDAPTIYISGVCVFGGVEIK